MKKNPKWKILLNLVLLLAILGVMFYFIQNSMGAIFVELKETKLIVLIGVLSLGLLHQFFEGCGIKETVRGFSNSFTTFDGMMTSFYTAFYRVITFGAGTILAEIGFYKKKGIKISQGIGASTLHTVIYKLAIVTYAVLNLFFYFTSMLEQRPQMIVLILIGIALTSLLIVTLVVLSLSLQVQVAVLLICNRFVHNKKLRGYVDRMNLQINALHHAMQSVLSDKTSMLKIYLFNLLKVGSWYVIPFVCLQEEAGGFNFFLAFALTSFTLVLSGVIPSPAGIGSFDFVYLFMFQPVTGTVDAVSSLLLYRFASYVLPFLLGFIVFLRERRKAITDNIEEISQP
ncbi:MAG: lysylphosphatidylglycerol synthase domain-containing protein [Tetragenococcus sp.]|nr:lysylphosphatidylglycerol synthase domain-containing protein [Tetragenococcus sp.]